MKLKRRHLPLLLPALAQAQKPSLASKVYRFEDLPVRENGANKSRAILNGATAGAYPIEIHMTELAPGLMPHAAHRHAHAEMVMLQEGTLEITIEGQVTTAGAGSVVYVAPNEMHGWKNAGTGRARYFVMALGRP
ncbi:MAG: cupin domain-containing protein [Bryobacterales bacterium]|nr:cupin domain-containing protein [Bryobacterales bacterium]